MAAFVYMLRCKDGSLYTGWTNDLEHRLAMHNSGRGAKYTRGRGPLELVYSEELPDKEAALRRECAIKKLRREQKLLLDYARMAVTEENVDILARQALAARPSVSASTLADEYPNDFARIIGLHTYSQSPRRCYDIQLTGEWATRGGFRFEEFTLTPRKEDAEDDRNE